MTRTFLANSIHSIGEAAMVRAVAEIYTGRKPTFRACFHAALQRLIWVFVTAIIVATATVIGFYLCFYIPGIIIAISCLVSTPAVVMERKDPLAAIARSYDLTMYHRWYIFKNLLAVAVAEVMVKYAVAQLFNTNTYVWFFTLRGEWIRSLPQTIFYPLYAILEAVIYINLRIQQEGLTVESLAQELDDTDHGGAFSSYRRVPLVSLEESSAAMNSSPLSPASAPPFATEYHQSTQVMVQDGV